MRKLKCGNIIGIKGRVKGRALSSVAGDSSLTRAVVAVRAFPEPARQVFADADRELPLCSPDVSAATPTLELVYITLERRKAGTVANTCLAGSGKARTATTARVRAPSPATLLSALPLTLP